MKIKTHLIYISIIGFTTLVMIYLFGKIEYTIEPYSTWDLASYRAIAKASPHLNPNIGLPFAYRILGPYLVGLLSFSDPLTFYTFTVLASFAVVFLLYFFLNSMGIGAGVSVFVTVLYSFNKHLYGYTLWNFFQINDVLSLIYILLLFWSMMRNNWIGFGLVMLLGVLTRETSLLMLPVAFFYLVEKKIFSREAKYVLMVTILTLMVFGSLRWLIKASGDNLIQSFLFYSVKIFSMETWFRLIINPFIPLSLFPLIFFKRTLDFFRDKKYALVFLFLVFLSTLFGKNNERLMAPAFIVFYWLMGSIMDSERFKMNKLILSIIALGTFVSSFHHEISRFNFMNRNLTFIISFGSLVVLSLITFIFQIKAENLDQGSTLIQNNLGGPTSGSSLSQP